MENAKYFGFGEYELDFIDLRNYQNFMEKYLAQAKEEFEISLKETNVSKDSPEYYLYVLDNITDRRTEISLIYPHNFRATFLIHIMSFIESTIRNICVNYEVNKSTETSYSAMKGSSNFIKTKEYLYKEAKINLDTNKEWNFINTVRKIRNKLVHNQGIVCDSDNDFIEIEMFVEEYDFISFGDKLFEKSKLNNHCHDLFIIKKEMNDLLINNTQIFVDNLLEQL